MIELAVRVVLPLILEQVVGHADLDIVRFTGEQQQRLVLRLPTEARDCAVIAVVIKASGYSQGALLLRIGSQRSFESVIGRALHQAQAERRRGNPEDDVPVRKLCLEIRLGEIAAA